MSVSIRRQVQRCTSSAIAVALALSLASCGSDSQSASTPTGTQTVAPKTVAPELGPDGQMVVDIIEKQMEDLDLTSAVYGVWRGEEVVAVGAAGDSPIGTPARPEMQVRIGQPMEPMLSTVLLLLEGEGVIDRNEPIAKWLPDFPRADQITPKMLADSTSGISDYVTNPDFDNAFQANPVREYTTKELIDWANARPPVFEPGKGWGYAHSDLVVLGEVLEKASGKSLGDLIQTRIFDPLNMKDSKVVLTPQITGSYLHGYTNERGTPEQPLFEDSTFWNPTAFRHSGNANTTVADVATWVRALMDGKLLSKEQATEFMRPSTAGLGPFTEDKFFAYGVIHEGDWIFMNPAYGGYHGIVYYDKKTKVLVIAYVTLGPNTSQAAPVDKAQPLGKAIATALQPDNPPEL